MVGRVGGVAELPGSGLQGHAVGTVDACPGENVDLKVAEQSKAVEVGLSTSGWVVPGDSGIPHKALCGLSLGCPPPSMERGPETAKAARLCFCPQQLASWAVPGWAGTTTAALLGRDAGSDSPVPRKVNGQDGCLGQMLALRAVSFLTKQRVAGLCQERSRALPGVHSALLLVLVGGLPPGLASAAGGGEALPGEALSSRSLEGLCSLAIGLQRPSRGGRVAGTKGGAGVRAGPGKPEK